MTTRIRLTLLGVCALFAFRVGLSAQAPRESYTFATLAGRAPTGSSDGVGAGVRFRLGLRSGVATDGQGTVYVADTKNHVIRRIQPSGIVSTIAGLAGVPGKSDGPGSSARFNQPTAVALDAQGILWVADTGSRTIRSVDSKGVVSTLPGSYFSSGIAIGPSGVLYVSEYSDTPGNNLFGVGSVYKLDSNGNVLARIKGFAGPTGIAVDADENLYVGEYDAHVISRRTPSGTVSVVAGTRGSQGSEDGVGGSARFQWIAALCIDRTSGDLFMVDDFYHTLRRIKRSGEVTTLAGLAGNPGGDNGIGQGARFSTPEGVAVDETGIYVADTGNSQIRKATTAGLVTTVAGNHVEPASGPIDGTGSGARFLNPGPMAMDHRGTLYVVDKDRIRKITPDGEVTSIPGNFGRGIAVDSADRLYCVTPEGLLRRSREGTVEVFSHAASMSDSLAVDAADSVYIANRFEPVIRKLDQKGVATLIAGIPGTFGAKDGPGLQATFGYPSAIAGDGRGNLYVTEGTEYRYMGTSYEGLGYHLLRKIDTNGVVTTIPLGFPLIDPEALAADSSGNVYIADAAACTVLKLTPEGRVFLIGGTSGARGYADGSGEGVVFSSPNGLAVDAQGTLYVSDGTSAAFLYQDGNQVIRKGWRSSDVVPLALGNAMHGPNRFGFTLTGTLGKPAVVEASGDLVHWLPVMTNSQGGVATFIDPLETGATPRFFRATSQ